MKKILLISAIALTSTMGMAQTKLGEGTDINENALLELNAPDKGLLLPRVALENTKLATPLKEHVAGMTVYNTTRVNDVVPGFYYNDGHKWQQMVTTDYKAVKFFYMPTITFDTSKDATGQTKNLFEEYKKQFALDNVNHVISEGAPVQGIPYFEEPTALYYYVTDFDPAVFSNITISKEGVMTYDVTAAATDTSIINIVFVVKE